MASGDDDDKHHVINMETAPRSKVDLVSDSSNSYQSVIPQERKRVKIMILSRQ